MTTPLLPFGNLTTWGSPWHGLVKNNVLTLANTDTMNYPQPGSGDTFLVKFAGVPDVDRTVEQQAADTLSGYDWRNYAIVAGNGFQLHGRSIGSPWLYKDGTGKVWRIKVTFVSGTTVKVLFTEFGRVRLGDEPGEEYEQFLSVSGTGISTIQSISIMDVKPNGTEALFLFERVNQKAMVKLTVDAGVCSASTIKSVDEMEVDHSVPEVVNTIPNEAEHTPSYYRVDFAGSNIEEDPGYIEFSSSPLPDIYDEAGETVGNAESFGAFFYIVGSEMKEETTATQYFLWACYDASGNIHFYSSLYERYDRSNTVSDGDYSGSYSASATGGTALSMSGAITLNSGTRVTKQQTYTYQLLRDAQVMDEYVVELNQETYNGTIRIFTGASNVVEIDDGSFDILPGGSAGSTTPVSSDEKSATFNEDPLDADLDVTYETSYYLPTSPRQYESLSGDLPSFEIVQSTNKLTHAVVEYNYQSGYLVGVHVAPDAQDAITSEVNDLEALFATFQPITKTIVREKDSVTTYV